MAEIKTTTAKPVSDVLRRLMILRNAYCKVGELCEYGTDRIEQFNTFMPLIADSLPANLVKVNLFMDFIAKMRIEAEQAVLIINREISEIQPWVNITLKSHKFHVKVLSLQIFGGTPALEIDYQLSFPDADSNKRGIKDEYNKCVKIARLILLSTVQDIEPSGS